MSLKKQTLWSMAPLLVVTVLNIFSVPLFYRYLGAEMYALWFYVLTFTGTFGFMDLGLGVAVGRYIGVAIGEGDRGAVRSYWATGNAVAIPLLAAMALVFVALGVFCGPKWFHVSPGNVNLLRWSFLVGGVGLFLSYYTQFWNILSQAHLDFRFISILKVVVALQILVTIVLAKFTRNPLVLITWGTSVSLIQLAVFIWHSKKSYGLGFHFREASMQRVREMASYTGKTFATLLVNSLFGSMDRLVLGKFAPAADFAHYTIAANVGGRVQGLSQAIMGPVFHNTSRAIGAKSDVSPAAIYNETFRFTFDWYLLLAVWVVAWHAVFLEAWLGKALGSSVTPLFSPVVIAFCLTAISNISAAQLGPLNRLGIGLFFHIAASLLVIAGVYLGWTFGGVRGVAYGFLCSRAALVAQDLYVIRLIGAGGWLASSTWIHTAGQIAVALLFFAIARLFPASLYILLVIALTHGGLVACWLLHRSGIKFPFRLIPVRKSA